MPAHSGRTYLTGDARGASLCTTTASSRRGTNHTTPTPTAPTQLPKACSILLPQPAPYCITHRITACPRAWPLPSSFLAYRRSSLYIAFHYATTPYRIRINYSAAFACASVDDRGNNLRPPRNLRATIQTRLPTIPSRAGYYHLPYINEFKARLVPTPA